MLKRSKGERTYNSSRKIEIPDQEILLEAGDLLFLMSKFPQEGSSFQEERRAVLEAFAKLRDTVYRNKGMDYYSQALDSFDTHQDTVFITVIDRNAKELLAAATVKQGLGQDINTKGYFTIKGDLRKVDGGRRIMVHDPASGGKAMKHLKTEDTIELSIAQMLPHLPVDDMRYIELASFCLDPEMRLKKLDGRLVSDMLYEMTFKLIDRMNIDFFVTEAVPANMQRFNEAATKYYIGEKGQLFPFRKPTLDPSEQYVYLVNSEGNIIRDPSNQPTKVRIISNDGDDDIRTVGFK